MSFSVSYNKVNDPSEAFNLVQGTVEHGMLKKFKVNADVDYDESSKKVKAKGKGFELDIAFFEDKATVDLHLGLLLKPMRSKIEAIIKKEFEDIL
jgi:hypothetical protein